MPRVDRSLVEDLGIGEEVVEMTIQGMRPKHIADTLRQREDVKTKLVMRDVSLLPTDIQSYVAKDLERKSALLGTTLEDNRAAAMDIVAATKSRVEGALKAMAQWETLAQRAGDLLSLELDAYEETRDLDPANAHFPAAQFDVTRKAVQAVLIGVRAIRSDPQILGIVKANTVNINQGVSQEELHDIVMALGLKLGHDQAATSRAYTGVLMDRRKNKRPATDTPFTVSPMASAIEKAAMFPPAEGATKV